MNKEFDKWWKALVGNSTKWTTHERLAALQAWEYQKDNADFVMKSLDMCIEGRDYYRERLRSAEKLVWVWVGIATITALILCGYMAWDLI